MNEEITTKVACTLDEGKWARMHEQSRRVFDTDAIAPTQHCCGGENLETKIAELFVVARPHGYYAGGEYADMSPCCKSSAMTENNFVKEGYRIRKLTPREVFRLMGCDEPTIDKLLSAGISNSQLYKLAGNSIVVDVLYHIFRRMFVDTDVQQGEQIIIF